jgi:RNA polymerase sigma-70 factor (ECF subfamily)
VVRSGRRSVEAPRDQVPDARPSGDRRGSISFVRSAVLVEGVRARDPAALGELHDRFAEPVLRILLRILGPDRDLPDLQHDAFVRALESIGELRDPDALASWMSAIAVHTARAAIERRSRRRRWLLFLPDDTLPEPEAVDPRAGHDAREVLSAVYAVLGRMPADERIAFALRHLDDRELTDVAEICGVSLSSIKRRLARAEARFTKVARGVPALAEYLQGGSSWMGG